MSTNSISNSIKSTSTPAMKIKNILLSLSLILTCLTPSMVLAQSIEIQQLQQRQQSYQAHVNNLQNKIGLYMLGNLAPAAAVLASGSGLAAILGDNIDPSTRGAMLFAGAIGIAYCADSSNTQYCANVVAQLTAYGIELNNYNQEINAISRQINSLQ